jgi:hypothetical protein
LSGTLRLAQDRHGARTSHPGAAQQLQQQRFRLVVSMVRQRHEIALLTRKSLMAQFAGRRLDAMRAQRRDVHMFDTQRDLKTGTQVNAKIRPSIRIRTDAVMDMKCGQLPFVLWGKVMQQMQQYY